MAAHDHLNPNQLKLFMSGNEWQNTVTSSVDSVGTGDEMQGLWDYKLDEAMEDPSTGVHGAGIHQSMLKHGYDPSQHSEYDKPTMYVHDKYEYDDESSRWKATDEPAFQQGEGHHRIAAAAHIERTTGKPIWIPTNYK